MAGYLIDKDKGKCYGCEACVQICPKSALKMEEDDEGFRYPILNKDLCVKCNLCHQVCLYENMPVRYGKDKYVFGGYIKDEEVRFESTSVLAYWYLVKYFWLLLPFYDTIKETAVISYGKTKKVQNQTYG